MLARRRVAGQLLKLPVVGLLAVGLAAFQPPSARAAVVASYTAVPLQGPPGTCISVAKAVNDAGDAAGLAQFPGSQPANTSHEYAFYWHAGSLIRLPPGDSSEAAVAGNGSCSDQANYMANDLNAAGTVVGWAYFKDPNPANVDDQLAAVWPSGASAPTSLGLLPSATPAKCFSEAPSFTSQADAINASGDIAGESTSCTASGFSQYDAVLVPHGGTLASSGQVIGTPPSQGIATGVAINSSDQVVVNKQPPLSANANESDLWTKAGNKTVQLPFVASFWSNVLNDSGVVVGTDNNHPVYSVTGGAEKQLTPAGGLASGFANGVNADGDVVGYSFGSGQPIATLWRTAVPPATGTPPAPVDLQTLLPQGSPQLVAGLAISKNGTILASSQSGYQILVPGGQRISGRLTDPQGEGIAGITVDVKGSDGVDHPERTDASGAFVASLDPGTYTVTPTGTGPNAATEFTPGHCDGTTGTDSCQIHLAKDQSAVADFSGAFKLFAKVTDDTGAAAGGVRIVMQRDSRPSDQVTASTQSDGTVEKDLGPGGWVISAMKKGDMSFFPVGSTDCAVQDTGCHVTLDRDREVKFSSCVVPDPHGTPLPGSLATSGDIPGAKTFGSLEAVGCWKDTGDGKTFTSTQPVRLDGIDVEPDAGTTITLDAAGPHVSSDGPVTVWIGGIPAWKSPKFGMTFSGSGGSVSDIASGSSSTGVTPNVLGWPINIGTGNPVGNNGGTIGVPWTFSPGTTSISLQGQVGPRFPETMQATWNVGDGRFERPGRPGEPSVVPVKSVALQATMELTNRRGLQFGGCFAPFNDKQLKLFGRDAGSLALVQICFDPNPTNERWYGQALFELPEDAGFAVIRQINVQLTFQNIKAGGAFDLRGYDLQGLQFQVAGLGGHGVPIGQGIFLQRLGGGFQWDYSRHPPILLTNVTGGLSLGPSVELPFGSNAPGSAELLSVDGKIEWSFFTDPTIWNLSGQISLLHATPYEIDLGSGKVTYYVSDGAGKQGGRADISADGQLHLHVPFFGDIGGIAHLTGFMVPDQPLPGTGTKGRLVQLEGNARFEFGKSFTTFNVLLSNTVLGLCYHLSSGAEAGIYYDVVHGGEPPSGCDFTKFRVPTPAPPQVTPAEAGHDARAAGVVPGSRGFRVARGLKAMSIAIRGAGSPPRVVLFGPGTRIVTPPAGKLLINRKELVVQDPARATTLITVSAPRPGVWTVAPLPGSARIRSLLESVPAPLAQIKASAAPSRCGVQLRYRMRSAAGERIDLYAQDGADRLLLGRAHVPGASIRFHLDPAATGRGEIVASATRGSLPLGLQTLARFVNARSNGSEKPRGLRVHGRVLSWRISCGATRYQIKLVHGHKTIVRKARRNRVRLPKLRGAYRLTVLALDSAGTPLGSTTIRIRFHS